MDFIRKFSKILIITLYSVLFSILSEITYAERELIGFEIGSSDAPISIIEYRSLTCSHCADFTNDVFPELEKKYIESGKVKFELRPFVLNAVDLMAFKLLNSVDKKDFLSLDKLLFKDQDKWLVTSDPEKILENSKNALKKYALLFGMSEERFNQILNDKELEEWILSMRVDGSKNFKIQSTPSFIIDGKLYSGNMSFSKFEKVLN